MLEVNISTNASSRIKRLSANKSNTVALRIARVAKADHRKYRACGVIGDTAWSSASDDKIKSFICAADIRLATCLTKTYAKIRKVAVLLS